MGVANRRQRSRERGLEVASADRTGRGADARVRSRQTLPAGRGARLRWNQNTAALWLIIGIFAGYYYWTVRPRLTQPIRGITLYTVLTDALLHGQTSLRLTPKPELLALKDPYDPQLNAPYRIHDASLYKGRYYVYFGPAPVVALFLPYLVITGEFLPDRIGTWAFAAAAFAMACLFLRLLLGRWWPRAPRWLLYFLCACLGFSNIFPFLLRRPAVYETAIAAGHFFTFLALYAIARSAFGSRNPRAMAVLGGIALAGALGSRPQMVLAVVALGWFLIPGADGTPRDRFRRMACALAAFAAGSALLLLYNYVRFDSPFEFGNHYQLAGVDVRKLQYFSVTRMLRNLWFSVLEPLRLRSQFPFVVLAPNPPFRLPKGFLGVELVAGIVWTGPLALMLAASSWVWRKTEPARRLEWSVCVATLVLLGAAWICVDGLLGSTMRYQADFAAVLFVAAALVIGGLVQHVQPNARRWVCRAVVALGLFGIVVNGAIGMTGYYDNFRADAPAQYETIANWFRPLAKVLAWCGIPPNRPPAPEVSVN